MPRDQVSIGKDLQQAQSAVNQGKLDDAFTLSLQALDAASRAADREQIVWQLANIATNMAQRKQPAWGEQLYQRLFGLVQSWTPDSLEPLRQVTQSYPRFLMAQPARLAEVPAAIER